MALHVYHLYNWHASLIFSWIMNLLILKIKKNLIN
jgi:hypothetical protein